MKTIAITIEEHDLERIDRLVSNKIPATSNRSKVIREAVRDYLSRAERSTEEQREKEIFRRHRGRLTREAEALVKEQAKP